MRILELMGMSSTKYGGIEKFNKKLVDIDKSDDFVFVYVEKPECDDYIKDMTTDNSQIKEIAAILLFRYKTCALVM